MDETKLGCINNSNYMIWRTAAGKHHACARHVVGGRRVGSWSKDLPSLHGLLACAVPELLGGGGCCGRQQLSPLQSDMDDVYDPEEDEKNKTKESSRRAYSGKAASASGDKKTRKTDQRKSQESDGNERSSDVPTSGKDADPRKFSFTVKEHGDCVKVCSMHACNMYISVCVCVYIYIYTYIRA
jgi:hypothetical protein